MERLSKTMLSSSRVYSISRLLPLAILVQLLAFASESKAVDGLSSTKLIVPGAGTVPKGHLEAEPFFSLEFIDNKNDTIKFGGGFRLTFGCLENLEAGVDIDYLNVENSGLISAETNFEDTSVGFKLRLIDQGADLPFTLAYQAGITIPGGKDAEWEVEPFGFILTKDFTDKFSIDADFVFGLIEPESWSITTNAGIGYYINSRFQPVLEAEYAYEGASPGAGASVLNISAGFTWDPSDWFSFSLGATPDIYVRNTEKEVEITSAFTFIF